DQADRFPACAHSRLAESTAATAATAAATAATARAGGPAAKDGRGAVQQGEEAAAHRREAGEAAPCHLVQRWRAATAARATAGLLRVGAPAITMGTNIGVIAIRPIPGRRRGVDGGKRLDPALFEAKGDRIGQV